MRKQTQSDIAMKVMSTTVPGPGWYALRMILNSEYGLDFGKRGLITTRKPTDMDIAVHRSGMTPGKDMFGVEPPYLSGAYKVRHDKPYLNTDNL